MANATTKKTTKESTREKITLGQLLEIYRGSYIQIVSPDEEKWIFATEIWLGSRGLLKPWLDYPIDEITAENCFRDGVFHVIRVGLGEKTDKD